MQIEIRINLLLISGLCSLIVTPLKKTRLRTVGVFFLTTVISQVSLPLNAPLHEGFWPLPQFTNSFCESWTLSFLYLWILIVTAVLTGWQPLSCGTAASIPGKALSLPPAGSPHALTSSFRIPRQGISHIYVTGSPMCKIQVLLPLVFLWDAYVETKNKNCFPSSVKKNHHVIELLWPHVLIQKASQNGAGAS